MPELPEVETIARRLRRSIVGGVILGLELLPKARVRGTVPPPSLEGLRVEKVGRRGKILIVHAGPSRCLLFHLGMSGRLEVKGTREIGPHCRLIIGGQKGGRPFFLHFSDARRFGYLLILEEQESRTAAPLAGQGPDALKISKEELAAVLLGTSRAIKSLMLDQSRIAGIGNIYADEILHRSGVHPLTPADLLAGRKAAAIHASMVEILQRAILRGGSSVRDYVTPDGSPGSFQEEHRVYRRGGGPCFKCASPILRIVVGGRGTYFCPRCQPLRAAGRRGGSRRSGGAKRRRRLNPP